MIIEDEVSEGVRGFRIMDPDLYTWKCVHFHHTGLSSLLPFAFPESVMYNMQIWHQLAHTEVSLLSVRDTKNRHLSLIPRHQNVNSLLWTSVQTGAQVSALFLMVQHMDAQEEYLRVSPRHTKSPKWEGASENCLVLP